MNSTFPTTVKIIGALDCSGSMKEMGCEPYQAWNDFVQQQKEKNNGKEISVSLYTFNNKVKSIYTNIPVDEVEEYSDYHPRGSTALYDTLRVIIAEHHNGGSMSKTVLVIITDGKDNASAPPCVPYKNSREEIEMKVKNLQDHHDWQVCYLACGLEAFNAGIDCGFDSANMASFDKNPGGLTTLTRQLSRCVSEYTSGMCSSVDLNRSVSVPSPPKPCMVNNPYSSPPPLPLCRSRAHNTPIGQR